MIYRIRDFLGNEKNSTPAFRRALELMQSGDTLCLEGGRYDLYVEGARTEYYYISNNDHGVKPIGLPIIEKENITVDGGGAELIFHGEILPVVVDRSKNIKLSGFSIDYEIPMYAQAEVVETSPERTVIKFDGKQFWCRVDEDGYWCFYSESEEWKWERHRRDDVITLEFDKEGNPCYYSIPYFPHPGGYEDHGFLNCMYTQPLQARF